MADKKDLLKKIIKGGAKAASEIVSYYPGWGRLKNETLGKKADNLTDDIKTLRKMSDVDSEKYSKMYPRETSDQGEDPEGRKRRKQHIAKFMKRRASGKNGISANPFTDLY